MVDFYSTGGTGDSYYKEYHNIYENLNPEKHQSISLDEYIEDQKHVYI